MYPYTLATCFNVTFFKSKIVQVVSTNLPVILQQAGYPISHYTMGGPYQPNIFKLLILDDQIL